jgi:hypothetical protein
MKNGNVEFLWRNPELPRAFAAGVCLHGHTMHSQECLNFLPRYLEKAPGLSLMARGVDFNRAYWTPPLSPAAALFLEREQIAALGLAPLVSLTDHDNIEAGVTLQVTADRRETPVSVEWTVPYEGSIFHLGIHNLPSGADRSWMAAMASYTARPDNSLLAELLDGLFATRGVLMVLNHPFWLEEGVTESAHDRALRLFLANHLPWIDAFELNGTRAWSENARAAELASCHGRPAISGGDRHGREPSACVNLTNALSFGGFVEEIKGGQSTVLFLPHYRECMAMRVLEASWDILKPYSEYPRRERWTDRIFYRGGDGVARPLSELWEGRAPWSLQAAAWLVELLARGPLRPALRMLLMRRGEILP